MTLKNALLLRGIVPKRVAAKHGKALEEEEHVDEEHPDMDTAGAETCD